MKTGGGRGWKGGIGGIRFLPVLHFLPVLP
jgi:hypothetical protein